MIAARAVLTAPSLIGRSLIVLGAMLVGAMPSVAAATGETGLDERVAAALATAQKAEQAADPATLAAALRIIERAGAHPMDGWTGTDPVPGWRTLAPPAGSPLRGSPLGPGYRSGRIGAGQSDSFQQVFLSGRKASIALSSAGTEPLSLRVVDASHKPVCVADALQRACRWVPIFTQRYLIEVRNGGQSQANYFLVVD